jgi:hypothetical protein
VIIDDPEVWRAASVIIHQYGDDALSRAAQRADELLARGDADGYSIWMRILEAVVELTRTELKDDEQAH